MIISLTTYVLELAFAKSRIDLKGKNGEKSVVAHCKR
jgi:hypothetical protein